MKPIGTPFSIVSIGIAIAIAIAIALALALSTPVTAMSLPNNKNKKAERAPDASMEATYNDLAKRAIALYESGRGTGLDGRCWIGIAGGPGAGKSTVAAAVARKICELGDSLQQSSIGNNESDTGAEERPTRSFPIRAVAIPMDGYHHTRKELSRVTESFGNKDDDGTEGMSRRGAPWTFDAFALARDLGEAKSSGRASLPKYDRVLSDPVGNAVLVEECHTIVLVEGNYLILGLLSAEIDPSNQTPRKGSVLSKACSDLLCPVPVGKEIDRWKETSKLWDETWFVAPPGDHSVETQRDRIIERSLETWKPSKTKAWGGGTDREAAIRRAEFNDVRNARLVDSCKTYADLVVDSI